LTFFYFQDIQRGKEDFWEGGVMMKKVKLIIALLIMGIFLIPYYGEEALGQAKDEVQRLIDELKDPSWQMRWYAASALGEMKEPRAVEPLIGVLKNDKQGYVRAMAAWALGEIKDRRAVEPLIDGIMDESDDVKKASPLALKGITGQDLGQDPAKWREWWEKNK
jgi:hypothetical protein